ncbi:MAG: DDE-type integrase/transposase/recombinase [Planctomycetes bacterium]|nr:DDE-type integrase/transposase/recombinase [Planctomycetota bacterium]NOG83296.1 DDE-type integrase/transposase/recombinase [Planctomycetota bacterium]
MGFRKKPGLSTINRVLKRNDLVIEKSRHKNETTSGKYYPIIKTKHPGHVHQLDLVTPRYIKGYGSIVSVNRIDVYTNQANLEQYTDKGAESVISFLINDWKAFGLPRFLQLDNEASFRGSLYHSKTFGKLSRFCLNFGVEIVFIPFKEPWRNGYIENFNKRFNELLWQSKSFRDLKDLRVESKKFRNKHNNYQKYKKETFSQQYCKGYTQNFLPEGFTFDPSWVLPITNGRIHFIRLVNEKGDITILNEEFYINKALSFEYVWAILNTRKKELSVYYQAAPEAPKQLIRTESYKLRESVKNRIHIEQFC